MEDKEVIPFLAFGRKVEIVAEPYESSRANVTMQIEPAGCDSYIKIGKRG